jgi:predicted nucleotidyltransferase
MLSLEHMTQLLQEWCRERPVRLCVLFGSQATGRAHQYSDVDLAVWPARVLSTPERLRWVRQLEDLLGQNVSLVLVSVDLDPVLGMEIFRQRHLIYECEPQLWCHQRLQLWHAYNDSLPFIRTAWQQLHDFAEEVRHGS